MNLELKDISLSFSHKAVLDCLNLQFSQGQIHGLLGENGAGKSTTANIICGELKPQKGQLLLDGKEVIFNSPKEAIEHGICYVHQRPMLSESLTVKENLLLGVHKPDMNKIQQEADIWLKDINLKTSVKKLGQDSRFFVSLCGAFLRNPKILILDEPTALLNEAQREFLFTNLQKLAENELNVIVITHSIKEAKNYCNTISFLENGHLKEDFSLEEFSIKVETSVKEKESDKSINTQEIKQLEFRNITVKPSKSPAINNINFSVKQGQILLIQGLAEDGLSTIENLLTGMSTEKKEGTIILRQGAEKLLHSINLKHEPFNTRILRNKMKISTGIVPTDKKFRGSNPDLTIEQILTAGNKDQKNTFSYAKKLISLSNINITPAEKAKNLSGGMLQRLIYNREIISSPELLILCQPLQGLDSSAASQISSSIRKTASKGSMVIVLSSRDFPEEYCDKIYNLKNGKLQEAQ